MTFLYVTTDGAVVRKQGESFKVRGPDGVLLADVEARNLEAVCILSSVQVTTRALAEMLEHGRLNVFSHRIFPYSSLYLPSPKVVCLPRCATRPYSKRGMNRSSAPRYVIEPTSPPIHIFRSWRDE